MCMYSHSMCAALHSITDNSMADVFGLEGSEECSICLTERKAYMLLPCRHLCVCKDCFR
jgi:Zinc finger, C3HC4 type (RING finger)